MIKKKKKKLYMKNVEQAKLYITETAKQEPVWYEIEEEWNIK